MEETFVLPCHQQEDHSNDIRGGIDEDLTADHTKTGMIVQKVMGLRQILTSQQKRFAESSTSCLKDTDS